MITAGPAVVLVGTRARAYDPVKAFAWQGQAFGDLPEMHETAP